MAGKHSDRRRVTPKIMVIIAMVIIAILLLYFGFEITFSGNKIENQLQLASVVSALILAVITIVAVLATIEGNRQVLAEMRNDRRVDLIRAQLEELYSKILASEVKQPGYSPIDFDSIETLRQKRYLAGPKLQGLLEGFIENYDRQMVKARERETVWSTSNDVQQREKYDVELDRLRDATNDSANAVLQTTKSEMVELVKELASLVSIQESEPKVRKGGFQKVDCPSSEENIQSKKE